MVYAVLFLGTPCITFNKFAQTPEIDMKNLGVISSSSNCFSYPSIKTVNQHDHRRALEDFLTSITEI